MCKSNPYIRVLPTNVLMIMFLPPAVAARIQGGEADRRAAEGHCQEGAGQSHHRVGQHQEEAGDHHDTEVKRRQGPQRHEAHQG